MTMLMMVMGKWSFGALPILSPGRMMMMGKWSPPHRQGVQSIIEITSALPLAQTSHWDSCMHMVIIVSLKMNMVIIVILNMIISTILKMHMVIISISLKMNMIISIMAVNREDGDIFTTAYLHWFKCSMCSEVTQWDGISLLIYVLVWCFLRFVTVENVWSHFCEIESSIVFITIRKKRGLVVVARRQAWLRDPLSEPLPSSLFRISSSTHPSPHLSILVIFAFSSSSHPSFSFVFSSSTHPSFSITFSAFTHPSLSFNLSSSSHPLSSFINITRTLFHKCVS